MYNTNESVSKMKAYQSVMINEPCLVNYELWHAFEIANKNVKHTF